MPVSKTSALPLGYTPFAFIISGLKVVREARLELAHLTALEPKSSASTKFRHSRNSGYDGIRTCDPSIMSAVL
ncbi:Conserved hypothetical protein (Putative RNA) [Candidatus Hamiltonella defensa (Bemisia tabaci)]|nr:Conserved hypothetical protein (Putative RNA) [Candidatus Hamiltonella defensa (Bemisia tabaci)]